VIQTGRGAQDGGPDLGRVAGRERAGGRGDVVDVARVRAQLPGTGADAFLERGQIGGKTIREPGREAPGSPASRPRISAMPSAGTRNSLAGSSATSSTGGCCAGRRIEGPHRVDLVAEHLDPDRQRGRRREDVHEAAAAGELAAAGDLEHRIVAEGEEFAEQLILVEAGTHAQTARFGRNLGRVEGVLQKRLDAGDQDARPA